MQDFAAKPNYGEKIRAYMNAKPNLASPWVRLAAPSQVWFLLRFMIVAFAYVQNLGDPSFFVGFIKSLKKSDRIGMF
jgi:hypothetical protein